MTNPLAYLGATEATTSTEGVVQFATVAEAITGTSTNTAVTPQGLAAVAIQGAPAASTLQAGIIEIATNGEAGAQVATNLALVPSNIPSIMAAPGAIGGTTPAAGTFTTVTFDTLVLTNPVDVAEGGTGIASYTTGDTLYASGATTLSKLAIGTARQLLQTNAGATAPQWASNIDIPGTLDVTGIVTFDDNATITGTTTCSGLLTCNASANIKTAGTTLGLGSDNDTAAVNLGIGTSARVITVGGSGANTIVVGNTQTAGSITAGNALTTGTLTLGGAANTGTLTLGRSTAGQTINCGNAVNVGAQIVNISAGAAGADSTVNVLSGDATAGTQTLNLGTGNRAKAINIGNGIDGNTVTVANGINTTAQTVSIANGASAANTTVNIMSGIGTAGAGTLAIGNNTRVTVAGLCDIAPAASRTTTVGGGTVVVAATTDTIDIGPDGATTNADSVKTVNVNSGGVTLGQVLTNIATGAVTSGTHTTAIATGNRAAGTMALNIMTGTGTKTITVGNADGGTTSSFLGPVNINASQNSNTAINSGTSTGTITIGNGLSGAIAIAGGAAVDIDAVGALALNSSGSTIDIGNDAVAQAVNISTGGAARTTTIGNTTGASAIVLNSGSGAVTCNTNLILGSVATQFQMNGGAVTDFIGTGVLTAGTQTIANTNISTTDRIFIQRIGVAASTTLGELSYTIINATSFTVTSLIVGTPGSTQTGDVSTYAYFIVRQN